jgi:LPXTG-motif cell wall-anchored protein
MRLARVAACTAATALLTTAAGVTSSAAAAKPELHYRSTTATGAVQVVLNLPAGVPALPGVPNPLVLTLLGTDATGFHGASAASDIATAHSYLAGGSLVTDSALAAVLGPLGRTLTSDLTHPGLKSASLISVPSNPLGLGLDVTNQTANVTAASRQAQSSANLASASLGSLSSLGLGVVLTPALATLNTAVATVTTQTAALTSALSAVPALPPLTIPNPLSPILGGPTTITTPTLDGGTLTTAIGELPAQIQAITDKLLNGAVVTLNGVTTSQAILPAASSIAATAQSQLLSIDLFGGLVRIDATKALASATAGITQGSATTAASATLLSVKVSTALGDLLTLVANDKGITAGLLNGTLGQVLSGPTQALVTTVDGALNTVLAQLTTLLSQLNSGADLIQQGTVSQSVSPDGHQASSHAVPAQVLIGLPVAPNLLTIAVGKADAVSALSVAAPTAVTPTTPIPELPHTGASTGAGALAALLLLAAGGTVALRRRTRH